MSVQGHSWWTAWTASGVIVHHENSYWMKEKLDIKDISSKVNLDAVVKIYDFLSKRLDF